MANPTTRATQYDHPQIKPLKSIRMMTLCQARTTAGERHRDARVTKPPGTGKTEIISPRDIYRFRPREYAQFHTNTAWETVPISKYASNNDTGPLVYNEFPDCNSKPLPIADPINSACYTTDDTESHHLNMSWAKLSSSLLTSLIF